MAGRRPRKKRPGQSLLAEDYNAVVDALIYDVVVGEGLHAERKEGVLAISLREDPAPRVHPARIVAVLGPPAGERASALNVGYKVARVGLPDSAAIEVPPERVVGRIDYTGNVWISPAPVGSFGLIREFRDADGESLPHFEVWKESPVVEEACGGEGGGGGGDFGGGVGVVELALGDGNGQLAMGNGGVDMEALWTQIVEIEDLANAGDERRVVVPEGARTVRCQAVGDGMAEGTAPAGELAIGRSLDGINAVYEGVGSLVIAGDGGVQGNTAMAGVIDVENVDSVHLLVRAMEGVTHVGRATVVLKFGKGR